MGATMMLAAIENIRSNYVCYLFTPGVNKVVRIKNDVLKELLVGHDDLFDEYSKIDRYERNFEGIIYLSLHILIQCLHECLGIATVCPYLLI